MKSHKLSKYNFTDKTQTHSFMLGHGDVIGMSSIVTGKSFQSEIVHRVPAAKTTGGRLNLTVRTIANQIDPDLKDSHHRSYPISATSTVFLWDGDSKLFSEEEINEIQKELFQTIEQHGVADVTKMFGKTFENKGRKVLELANVDGFKYTYAGKTVTGIAFTPLVRQLVMPRLAKIFGVEESKLWAHLVYYPTSECKLDYHDDGEDGINPHMIVSITFLEDPVGGVRPFQVRLKSAFPKKTKSGSESVTKKQKIKK